MAKLEHIAALNNFTASHNGKPLDQKSLLKPNAMLAKILVARFMSMTPEQQAAVKKVLTPETIEPLKILIPEMSNLLDRGMKFIQRKIRNG
jgi:hypothetical protein